MSQAGRLENNVTPGGDIETITGNTGGAVGPDSGQNIFFTASGGFEVTGNPGTNTLDLAPAGWTAGSVVFADSAVSFSQDNANFFWDDSANALGLGTNTPVSSAILELVSTTKGLRLPVMTTAQKNAIGTPVSGLEVYDSDLAEVQFYNGVAWVGTTSSGVTEIFGTADEINVSANTGSVTISLPTFVNIPGTMAINDATGGGNTALSVDAGGRWDGIDIYGTMNLAGSDLAGINFTATMTPDNNTHNSFVIRIQANHEITNDANDIYNFRSGAFLQAGTATNFYNMYLAAPSNPGGLTLTNSFGLFVQQPTLGSSLNKCATFAGGITVGSSYTNVNAPSNGALFQGNVAIGTDTPVSSALLTLVSTTQGFRLPVMTTAQKNAIGSPTAGLEVYDTDIDEVQFYNGTSWIGTTTSGVTSITGTTNQITASASTGAVTLSLPGFVAIPTRLTINEVGGSSSTLTINTVGNYTQAINMYGSLTGTGGDLIGIDISNTFTTDNSTHYACGIQNEYTAILTNGTQALYGYRGDITFQSGSVTNLYNIFISASQNGGAGTVTNAYSIYAELETAATNNYGAYIAGRTGIGTSTPLSQLGVVGGTAIGGTYGPLLAPTSGLIVEGDVGIGTNVPNVKLEVVDNDESVRFTAAASNASYISFYRTTTVLGNFGFTSGGTTSNFDVVNRTATGKFTIQTNGFNERVTVLSSGLVGINQVSPLSQLGITGNLSVGATYGALAAPTSGLIVEGAVGIGNSSPNGSVNIRDTTIGGRYDMLFLDNYNTTATTGKGSAIFFRTVNSGGSNFNQSLIYTATEVTTCDSSSLIFNTVSSGTAIDSVRIWSNNGQTIGSTYSNVSTGTAPPADGLTVEGNVGVGTATVSSAAAVEVVSTTQGVRFPNMTTTQRDAIGSPVAGLVIYNTSTGKLNVYTTVWEAITSA